MPVFSMGVFCVKGGYMGLLKKSMRTRSSWTVVVSRSEGGGHFTVVIRRLSRCRSAVPGKLVSQIPSDLPAEQGLLTWVSTGPQGPPKTWSVAKGVPANPNGRGESTHLGRPQRCTATGFSRCRINQHRPSLLAYRPTVKSTFSTSPCRRPLQVLLKMKVLDFPQRS